MVRKDRDKKNKIRNEFFHFTLKNNNKEKKKRKKR